MPLKVVDRVPGSTGSSALFTSRPFLDSRILSEGEARVGIENKERSEYASKDALILATIQGL